MKVEGIMRHQERIERAKALYLGCEIVIHNLAGENGDYVGRTGIVERVDDMGDLHGTWGFLAVIPGQDSFSILSRPKTD